MCSDNYFWHQVTYMHALCLKINKRYDEAYHSYTKLSDICQKAECNKLKDLACSIILLPLQKSRENIEDIIFNLLEVMKMHNKFDLWDFRVPENLVTI